MPLEVKEMIVPFYGQCIRISNGKIAAEIAVDKGPRIFSFGEENGENLFCSVQGDTSKKEEFHYYGGHRVSLALGENQIFYPDNDPVIYKVSPSGASFIPPCRENGLQIAMEIQMDEVMADMMVIHSVTNTSKERICTAVWSATMLNTGGIEILPQNKESGDLAELPDQVLAFWPGSRMKDPRLSFGEQDMYIFVSAEKSEKKDLTFGINNTSGWAAYVRENHIFVKRYVHNAQGCYPNHNCSFRTTVSDEFLEMGSYSPLYWIEPGETIRHVENFSLFSSSKRLETIDDSHVKMFLDSMQ